MPVPAAGAAAMPAPGGRTRRAGRTIPL